MLGSNGLVCLSNGKAADGGRGQRLRAWFRALDFANLTIRLVWDDQEEGLRMFLQGRNGVTAAEHLFWDRKEDAFFWDTLPGFMEPAAVCTFLGSDKKQVVLIGGADGYVRCSDHDSALDDGRKIECEVALPTIAVGASRRAVLSMLQGTLGRPGDACRWEISAAENQDDLMSAPVRASGLWSGVKQHVVMPSVGARSIMIRLKSAPVPAGDSTRFSLLSLAVKVADMGILPGRSA